MILNLAVVAAIVILSLAFCVWLSRRLTIRMPLLAEPESVTEPLNALAIQQIEEILNTH